LDDAGIEWVEGGVMDLARGVASRLDFGAHSNRQRPTWVAYNLSGDYRTVEEAVTMLKRWFRAAESEACQGELPSSVFEFRSDAISAELWISAPTKLEEGLRLTRDSIHAAPTAVAA
jgi:hypothetical protein